MDKNHRGWEYKVNKIGSNTLATGHAVHKREGGEHNTISNDWLKTASQVGDKPVKDCTPNIIGCLKPF